MGRITKLFTIYRGLPRSVYVLFAATVVNGAGIFVFPFMTLFLTKKLGMDERQAGNFMFFTSIAYLPGTLVGGKLADRFGRKKVMLVAQALSSAAFVPCGFLSLSLAGEGMAGAGAFLIPVFILLNIIFDGFADPARGAMRMDITVPENRQAAFSLNYLGHNLGFAVGPLIAGFLFTAAPQWLFWGNALAALVALGLVIAFVPESKPTEMQLEASLATDSSEKAYKGGLFSALKSRPVLLVFVCISTWYGFVYAQHRFSIPLQTDALFGDPGAALYGSLMTLNAVVVILLTAPVIALFKRFRPIVNVAFAGFLYAAGFGMLAFAGSPWFFYLSTVIWTIGEILNATNADVYVANHTPMSHRGRFNAILPLIWGFGWALSTPAGGALIEDRGIPTLWIVMFAIAAAASFALLGLDTYERRRGSRAAASHPEQPVG